MVSRPCSKGTSPCGVTARDCQASCSTRKIEENSGRAHEILKKNGVPTKYHVLKGKKHYDVYSGQCLDDVMKLEIPWFDKYLKGEE